MFRSVIMAAKGAGTAKTKGILKDKKMSREEKSMKYKTFIGNKTEGQGFADKRKRRTVYQYLKAETKEKQQEDKWTNRLQKIYAEVDSSDDDKPVQKKSKPDVAPKTHAVPESAKVSVFHREEKQWQQKKLEKDKKTEEMAANAKAKLEATERYRKEKRRKHKLLAKRNYKGQPNMSARMALLLEKIEMQNKS